MSTTFTVRTVWDLGESIHMIGTIEGGVIKGGEILHSDDDDLEIRVASVAIGGGTNISPHESTLIVESIPCAASELFGKVLTQQETPSSSDTKVGVGDAAK